MKELVKVLCLSILLLRSCTGNNPHHYDAVQLDVLSPDHNPCETSRGFFGRMAKFEHRVNYKYELTLRPGSYLTQAFQPRSGGGTAVDVEGLGGVLGAVEKGVADAMLASRIFQSACARGESKGPFKRGDVRNLLRNSERQLRAVGISSNPEDEILEDRKFGNVADLTRCIVITSNPFTSLFFYCSYMSCIR